MTDHSVFQHNLKPQHVETWAQCVLQKDTESEHISVVELIKQANNMLKTSPDLSTVENIRLCLKLWYVPGNKYI